ncbi:hypothetical protein DDB_G0277621 [Dictyostelium discoideum AX4]|uniref:Uncharacterized protein n=1 Tax=Dictyostelium discoideum TaxID=44689 RepID=Q54ZE8_DICDI|nr:hypothetical protein DDB_G0277621 [Dictyostelium discoideum AX4]EAL68628.1 hypothetical protein DDB_G0277621 [Dictyostelium discoideum AX4]|eukprot:XP_642549.1 hypothetical protein DDB_G0277621 [Dictyostelium discoideum AX4]
MQISSVLTPTTGGDVIIWNGATLIYDEFCYRAPCSVEYSPFGKCNDHLGNCICNNIAIGLNSDYNSEEEEEEEEEEKQQDEDSSSEESR